jgi:hypothetical protein
MHYWIKPLKAGVVATIIAAVLAASALPATAQLIRRGNDGTLHIDPLLCQTDYQVRQAVAAAGFRNIALNAPVNSHIRVRATKGHTVYLIDYEYCLGGGIVGIRPLRPATR